MREEHVERRLAAILAADVVGYSRLMGDDEVGTIARLKNCRRDVVDPTVAAFHGRIVKLMGDGALVEFASVVDAVQCAAAIQRRMALNDAELPEKKRLHFRIGVNLGDIVVDGDDIYGDGVNIAARLEAMAEPGGVCISGTAFDHAVHKVDVGFASLGELSLKNIAEPVRAYRVLLDPQQTGTILAAPARPRSRVAVVAGGAILLIAALVAGFLAWQRPPAQQRPSLAVLPFVNLSGDAAQDYFADGITEDLITDLTKLSGLDVIARNSVFSYRDHTESLAEIAQELGVRFVVEGSVRRTGDQIRLNAQLIDTASAKTLWADRFDGGDADLFSVQDEVSRKIAEVLGVLPTQAESERMARPPTSNLEAYDYFLRAEQAARTGEPVRLLEALSLYDKAQALDPTFAEAFAADARTTVYIFRRSFHDVIQGALARKRAYEKASRALEVDPDLASPYAILGVMQVIDRRYQEAVASAERAVQLGPGDADAQIALGYVQLFAGNHAEAIAAVEAALKLDPNLSALDREIAGLVYLVSGDIDNAVETLERTSRDAPTVGIFRVTLAAAYMLADRVEDARAAVAEGLRILDASQSFILRSLAAWRITYSHFRNAEDLAVTIDALRRAGLPEWPFGFTGEGQDRVQGKDIEALVIGHTLQGKLEPGGQPAIMQIGADGKAAFRTMTRMFTETVFVDGDMLCEQSENMFGRPDCGPVYRRGDPAGKTYSFTNSGKLFHFQVVN